MDLDVDGRHNGFVLDRLRRRPAAHSPRRSVSVVAQHTVRPEREAAVDHHDGRWRCVNPSVRNAHGYQVGYVVHAHDTVEPPMHADDYRRAGFIAHPLWVTAYDPAQRDAAGDTPNQNPGEPGLPRYVRDDQRLIDRDLVARVTLGHHHVTAAEVFPVLSTHRLTLELVPVNFFDANPGLDLRRAPFEAGQ